MRFDVDEIKYLCKIATAGSKEARELERIKKVFEDAYREGGKVDAKEEGVEHSLSNKKSIDKNVETSYNDNTKWVTSNGILTSGQMDNFYSRFAAITENLESANGIMTQNGEYMIAVSDIYDNSKEGIQNTIVYAKGTLDDVVITAVLEIDLYNETDLSDARRNVYETERRGIQQKTEGIFRRYDSFDFENARFEQRRFFGGAGYNNQLGTDRGASSGKAERTHSYRTTEQGHKIYYSERDLTDTNQASSTDGVFFDGESTKHSLSDSLSSEDAFPIRSDGYGITAEDVRFDETAEDIAPVKETEAKTEAAEPTVSQVEQVENVEITVNFYQAEQKINTPQRGERRKNLWKRPRMAMDFSHFYENKKYFLKNT